MENARVEAERLRRETEQIKAENQVINKKLEEEKEKH
jgi:hypothetical protein